MFNLSEIKELVKMIDKSSIEEFEIEKEGSRLYISKPKAATSQIVAHGAAPAVTHYAAVSPQPEVAPAPAQQAQVAGATSQDETPSASSSREGLHEITSPMVGTFYAASAPGEAPFVKKGDKVTENSVVCIIEAMKLMNEIVAEVNGEIVEVLVENAQLVEYGQPLFLVKI